MTLIESTNPFSGEIVKEFESFTEAQEEKK